jgi:hypothetical protein
MGAPPCWPSWNENIPFEINGRIQVSQEISIQKVASGWCEILPVVVLAPRKLWAWLTRIPSRRLFVEPRSATAAMG